MRWRPSGRCRMAPHSFDRKACIWDCAWRAPSAPGEQARIRRNSPDSVGSKHRFLCRLPHNHTACWASGGERPARTRQVKDIYCRCLAAPALATCPVLPDDLRAGAGFTANGWRAVARLVGDIFCVSQRVPQSIPGTGMAADIDSNGPGRQHLNYAPPPAFKIYTILGIVNCATPRKLRLPLAIGTSARFRIGALCYSMSRRSKPR